MCVDTFKCMEHLLDDDKGDVTLGVSRQQILNAPAYSPSKIYCFDRSQIIASYSIALCMKKDFRMQIQTDINETIKKLFEGGLFVKWHRDSQRCEKYEIPFSPSPKVTFDDLAGIFTFVYVVGSIMSISSFFCEKIIYHKMQQPNKHKIWIYLEQFFDGDRYYFKNLMETLQKS